ncbi:MAG TPA: LLM class flavin-dependent oxidoreductase [Actinomycetota bacterium]|jgi:alkanesulfonate monooxygenase SsuD/methylene tetrahydromethanopterin reductase-like flavin-dependent oxidoreductase (luciferase family)|nr:LLM class flavin-dependent oxidoreductase [Actinomycetota bacterium]
MTAVANERQPRTAFAVRDPLRWSDFAGLVRAGEDLGYEAVFLPEIAGRDAFAALTGLAAETRELRLGTGIVPMTSRSVQLTAMGAATVHERSGGRAVLGIGTGPAVPGALERLGAQVLTLRGLLAGQAVEHEGRSLSLSLDLGAAPPPVWISALGDRALRLAGEVADGVILNWCTPERAATATVQVRQAARAAGRDAGAITIAVYVRGSLGADPVPAGEALAAAAGEYARYPAYARQFRAMGLAEEAGRAAAGDPGPLAAAVCLPLDEDRARARLEVFREAGADLPVVYPIGGGASAPASLLATLEALAPRG